MHPARYIAASFAAPLAALLLPCMLAVSQVCSEADILRDGTVDDAAMRGAGTFLVVAVPVLYLVGTIFYAGIGHFLARTNQLSLRTSVLVASVAPWPLVVTGVVALAFSGRAIPESAAVLGIIGICMSIFAAVGAIAWWFIAAGAQRGDA